jgi:hypothetical protein
MSESLRLSATPYLHTYQVSFLLSIIKSYAAIALEIGIKQAINRYRRHICQVRENQRIKKKMSLIIFMIIDSDYSGTVNTACEEL